MSLPVDTIICWQVLGKSIAGSLRCVLVVLFHLCSGMHGCLQMKVRQSLSALYSLIWALWCDNINIKVKLYHVVIETRGNNRERQLIEDKLSNRSEKKKVGTVATVPF